MRLRSIVRFIRSHGVTCTLAPGCVLVYSVFTLRPGVETGASRAHGIDVDLVRSMREARHVLGY